MLNDSAFIRNCIIIFKSYMLVCAITGNPSTGIVDLKQSGNGTLINEDDNVIDPSQASVSWWLIFICVSSIFKS